jgi:hypothetical protein
MGVFGPSLLIESTDSMITILLKLIHSHGVMLPYNVIHSFEQSIHPDYKW